MPYYAAEDVFDPAWNYTAEEISDMTGIAPETIELAAKRGEISTVCTTARHGQGKAWNGAKVAAWINRQKFTIKPNDIVRRTVRPRPDPQ